MGGVVVDWGIDAIVRNYFGGLSLAEAIKTLWSNPSPMSQPTRLVRQPGAVPAPAKNALIVPQKKQTDLKAIVRKVLVRGKTQDDGFGFNFGGNFLENFVTWRLLALEGRLGGGKTLMSVALARWLFKNGYVRGVFSNFPIDPKFVPYVPSCVNTVVILDEGWISADERESATFKGYGAFFRKLGSYLISPSIYRVDRRMRPISCERKADYYAFGLWHYEWWDVRRDKGWFLFTGYDQLFNKYDHRFVPADDGGILETMLAEIKFLAKSRRSFYIPGQEMNLALPYADPLKDK